MSLAAPDRGSVKAGDSPHCRMGRRGCRILRRPCSMQEPAPSLARSILLAGGPPSSSPNPLAIAFSSSKGSPVTPAAGRGFSLSGVGLRLGALCYGSSVRMTA
jgi:hypothetical protein